MVEPKIRRTAILCLSALLTLSGCGAPPVYAPSYHGPTPEHYQVRRGDTLYSIGQRFHVDHQRIMLWNDIRDPQNLQVGQRLRLQPPSGDDGDTATEVATKGEPRVGKARVGDGSAGTEGAEEGERDPAGGERAEDEGTAPSGWRWPLKGRIIKQFGGEGRDRSNGIDIAAEAGTEIRAAAGGKVVYSGDGLRGYGNLVIIRHGGGYITTYAYNRVNLVAEDDRVASGDVVARVGRTGTADRESLHFEVRRRTEPVDPLEVLPAR
ncbi:MAG: M23 family metallopeptidase [Thiohalorhabdus sp.]|uniref:M23 family metallopeptidase n=1 Tax=Thiohalorhabdus sp. TaxID=3094134 RepID=UPI002FC2F365